MWQRFTERARRVIFHAQEEAAQLGTTDVQPEHLLLGLLRDTDSVGCKVLAALGVDRTLLSNHVATYMKARGQERDDLSQEMRLTPAARRVVDRAHAETRWLNNDHIGTEHLLLGIALGEKTFAGRALAGLGANVDRLRDAISRLQPCASEPQNEIPALETPWTDFYRALATATAAAGVLGEKEVSLEMLFRACLSFGTVAAQSLGNAGFQVAELVRVLGLRHRLVSGTAHRKALLGVEARTLIARLFARFAADGGAEPDSRDILLELLEEPAMQALQENIPVDLQKMRAVLEKSSN